jgi:site-specific recombinase XerD
MPPEVLQNEEVRALLAACGGTPMGLRHQALIALLYRAGLRIGEALELHPRDLNLATGEIRILHGKGDRFRIAGIDPGAAAMIEAWMRVRSRMTTSRPVAPDPPHATKASTAAVRDGVTSRGVPRTASTSIPGQSPMGGRNVIITQSSTALPRCAGTPLPSSAPLICTREGGRLSDAFVRRLMKRLAAKAGLDRRVHAHGLRHTHAAQLRAEGIDIGIISKQLGHRSILTTIRYLDHIAPVQVVKAMREREWQG